MIYYSVQLSTGIMLKWPELAVYSATQRTFHGLSYKKNKFEISEGGPRLKAGMKWWVAQNAFGIQDDFQHLMAYP